VREVAREHPPTPSYEEGEIGKFPPLYEEGGIGKEEGNGIATQALQWHSFSRYCIFGIAKMILSPL